MTSQVSSLHGALTRRMLIGLLIGSLFVTNLFAAPSLPSYTGSYIIQAASLDAAILAVQQAGGQVTDELAIINAVAATLDAGALAQLQSNQQLAIHQDNPVYAIGNAELEAAAAASAATDLLYPAEASSAVALHSRSVPTQTTQCARGRIRETNQVEDRPLRGAGVTIAVIDSGLISMPGTWQYRDADTGLLMGAQGDHCIIYQDFLRPSVANGNYDTNWRRTFNLTRLLPDSVDQNGHGTHVAATILDGRLDQLTGADTPSAVGIAPDANLLVARVLDANGSGRYATVISAIDWVVRNRDRFSVDVLNLSIYSPVSTPYWADPLNQAVMKAWQAGIVVVTGAGNQGPELATISAPGNIPYVITVGAARNALYSESGFDEIAPYSSRGPTESAFVKPDLVVSASRTVAFMPSDSTLAVQAPESMVTVPGSGDFGAGPLHSSHAYYQLSGTSMAAAQVSGLVALMLQEEPTLTNDQVKYRLMSTALTPVELDATTGVELPLYSPFDQGAGWVDIVAAVNSTELGNANPDMDIAVDLVIKKNKDHQHYWGYVQYDPTLNEFSIVLPNGTRVWAGGTRVWAGGTRVWAGGTRVWAGGTRVWAGGTRVWAGGTRVWAGGTRVWAGTDRSWVNATEEPSLTTSAFVQPVVDE